MFANNHKISLRQLKRMLVFDLFSVSSIIIPRIAFVSTGRDGGIAIILGTLYAFIYAFIILSFAREVKGDYLSYSKDNVGSLLTFVVGVLYIIKLFACCVFASKLFGDLIKVTLLEDTDNRIIILLLLVLSAYCASKGIETRARVAEILYLIVLIPIFAFLILGLRDIDYTNLMPILSEDTKTIMYGGYEVFLTFSIIEMLLFIVPFIKYRTTDAKKKRKLSSYVGQAIAIVGVLNLLFFIVSLGILGAGQTKRTLWSMVYMLQVIKIPGGFLQRQDAVLLGLWLLSIFTLVSGFLYYIVIISKHILRVPKENYLLVPFVLLIFGVASIPMETDEFYDYFSFYMKFVGMPQSILIPLFVVFIGKLKTLVNKTSAIRNILIIITCASVLTLTGCADKTEIEDRNFVQAIGIDYADEKYNVYYVLPDLKELTGQGVTEPEDLVVSLNGINFSRVEEDYKLRYNKRLDFSHLKAIIIGHGLSMNKEALIELNQYVKNKYELGKNVLFFLASDEAKDIIDLNDVLEGGIGEYLDRLYRINMSNTDKEEVTIGDLVRGMNNENEAVRVPIIREMNQRLESNGLGIFLDFRLVYEVSEEVGDYVELSNGYGKNKRLFINNNKIDEDEYVIHINSLGRKLDYEIREGKPYLILSIDGDASIEKGIVLSNDVPTKDMYYKHKTSTAKGEVTTEIEDFCNFYIRERIIGNLSEILKKEKIDYLNLYRLTSYKKSSIWYKYQERETNFIDDLQYEVNVNFRME